MTAASSSAERRLKPQRGKRRGELLAVIEIAKWRFQALRDWDGFALCDGALEEDGDGRHR